MSLPLERGAQRVRSWGLARKRGWGGGCHVTGGVIERSGPEHCIGNLGEGHGRRDSIHHSWDEQQRTRKATRL
jgi:hypothetical protein